jgi:hypothetical protein
MRRLGKDKRFPIARSADLLIEDVDDEKVIYDEQTTQAHCLTPLASVVFDNCDGQSSPAELARVASESLGEPVSEDQVQMALAQLEERELLASPPAIRISRRDMIHKSAAFGAAAGAAALIFTVDPTIAQAAGKCTSQMGCTTANCNTVCQPLSASCSGGEGNCGCNTTSHMCFCGQGCQ